MAGALKLAIRVDRRRSASTSSCLITKTGFEDDARHVYGGVTGKVKSWAGTDFVDVGTTDDGCSSNKDLRKVLLRVKNRRIIVAFICRRLRSFVLPQLRLCAYK